MGSFSHVFRFLKTPNESIRLVPKNWKFMASITILTLVLQSVLLLLLVYSEQFLTKMVETAIMDSLWPDSGYTPNQVSMFNLALLLLPAIPFWVGFQVISSLSLNAVILVSAMSYTGKKSSLRDLLSRIKRQRTKDQVSVDTIRRPRNVIGYELVGAVLAAYLVIYSYTNAITITIGVVIGIAFFILLLHATVIAVLAAVISAVEESCEQREAVEKAQHLVKGHRLHGFMLNMFVSLLFGMALGAYYWIVSDDKWHLNIEIHGLMFYLNSYSMAKIFLCVAYTVLYFQCKKHHGQEIAVFGKE